MPPIQVRPQAARSDADAAARVASAVRAGTDAVLTERAPAGRGAFWHAAAVLDARGSEPMRPPDPGPSTRASPSGAVDPSLSILVTPR